MFHQVFICNTDPEPDLPESYELEETKDLVTGDPKTACKEEETLNEKFNLTGSESVEHQVEEKIVIHDLFGVGQIKSEVKLEPVKGEVNASMDCLSYEDTKVCQESNIKEENEELSRTNKFKNCSALFKEESESSENKNNLGLCTETIKGSMLCKYDETLSNVLDFVDCTNSENTNSSINSRPFQTSVAGLSLNVMAEYDDVCEYIISDSIDPNLINSPSVELESKNRPTKSILLSLLEKTRGSNIDKSVGFSYNLRNDANVITRLRNKILFKVDKKLPNCPRPAKINKQIGHLAEEVSLDTLLSNNRLTPYLNAKRKRSCLTAETPLNAVNNNESIAKRSCSSLRDTNDSDSDWEQEYLASKEENSKSKTTRKKTSQVKLAQSESEKYPRLILSQSTNKLSIDFEKTLPTNSAQKSKAISKKSSLVKPAQRKSEKYPQSVLSQSTNELNIEFKRIVPKSKTQVFSNISINQISSQSPTLNPSEKQMLTVPSTPKHLVSHPTEEPQVPRTVNESTTHESTLESNSNASYVASIPEVVKETFAMEEHSVEKIMKQKTCLIVDEKQTTEISSNESQQEKTADPNESCLKEMEIRELSTANLKQTKTPEKYLEDSKDDAVNCLNRRFISSRMDQNENTSSTQDQSRKVINSLGSIDNPNLSCIESISGINRLNNTNTTAHCEISERNSTLSNNPLVIEEVNNSITIDVLNNKQTLTHDSTAHETPTMSEEGQNQYLNMEYLTLKYKLKPLRIVLHDCMNVATQTFDMKQSSNTVEKNRTVSLRKRSNATAYKYRDVDSSSNVTDSEDSCSDWEPGCFNSDDSSVGFKSFTKVNLGERTRSTNSSLDKMLLDNKECSEPSEHKSADLSDLRKTSREDPDAQDPESVFQCSDCGKMFESNNSFTQHKLDSLCGQQDEPSAKEFNRKRVNSEERAEWKKLAIRNATCRARNDNTYNVPSEKHQVSRARYSKVENEPVLPRSYKKDPKTGNYLEIKNSLATESTVSQLSNKSDVKNFSNQNNTNGRNTDWSGLSKELFVCSVCKKIFYSACSFNHHITTTLCFGKTRKLGFQCDLCGKLFTGLEKLNNHRNTHTNARPYKCKDCDKWFNSVNTRNSHHRQVHRKIFREKYLCSFCAMTTPSIEHLLAHEETHRLPEGASIPLNFECSQCGKRFISKFKLRSHHKDHRPHRCRQCNAKFVSKESFEEHNKTHKNNAEFKCEICSKVFKTRCSLVNHRTNSHVLTIKFFCDVCDKGFKTKHHIKQHMISHSDERPISCPECDETFKRKTHLKQHTAAFHGKGRTS